MNRIRADMEVDSKNGTSYGRYIIAAVLVAVIILIPAGTVVRMCVKHIPFSQYSENILGKHKLIGINTAITEAVSGGDYMESNEVLLGKNGWLFYKVTTDGTPLYDYMGINRYSDEQLKTVYANIEDLCEKIYYYKAKKRAEEGRPLFLPERDALENSVGLAVLTIPNKEQVYSEYMPATIEKISDTSRLDQLSGYIADRGKQIMVLDRYVPTWTYTDISEAFYEAHTGYPLYYKTDTHWTDEGAYLALATVMDEVRKRESDGYVSVKLYDEKDEDAESATDILDEVSFTEKSGFVGDLTKISATEDRYPEVSYVLEGDSVPNRYRTRDKLLIIGDSFGDAMQHVAKYCYSEVRFLDIKDYSENIDDILIEYDPDLVILECVERYLPRLAEDGMRLSANLD